MPFFRLTNLKTLKGNKAQANNVDSNEEEIRSDSEKENQKSKNNAKKSEKKSTPRKSLEDYIADGSGKHDYTLIFILLLIPCLRYLLESSPVIHNVSR